MRIGLGTYDIETAQKIQENFAKKRNTIKERAKGRMNGHILLRSRGNRDLYEKVTRDDGSVYFKSIKNSKGKDREMERRDALPTYDDCKMAVECMSADPVEEFIYNNEPFGEPQATEFRNSFQDALYYFAIRKITEARTP